MAFKALLIALSLTLSLSACGHRGDLKRPWEIEKEREEKALEDAERAAKQPAPQVTPTEAPAKPADGSL